MTARPAPTDPLEICDWYHVVAPSCAGQDLPHGFHVQTRRNYRLYELPSRRPITHADGSDPAAAAADRRGSD